MSGNSRLGSGGFGFAAIVLSAVVLGLVLTASGAGAYTQLYRFQYCSAIANDTGRLACYDDYAREVGLPPPDPGSTVSATQRHVGSWTIRTEAFSPDHPAAVFAFNDGKIVSGGSLGVLDMPTLVTRCVDRKTEIYIGFGTPLPLKSGSLAHSILYAVNPSKNSASAEPGVLSLKAKEKKHSRIQAELRLGEREPVTAMLRPSADGRALFFPNPVSLIRQMRLSPDMHFILEQKGAPSMTIFFSLDGMEDAITQLRNSCGW